MDDSEKPSLPPSLRELIEQERRRLGPHPPVEDLVAYQAGELPSEQEERLRDHVALCRECAQLLLDLRDFPDNISLTEGAPRPTPAEVEAAWEALQPRLKEPRPVPAPAPQPVEVPPAPVQPLRPPERRPAPAARWLAPLAAVFFLSTVGLSFWAISLQRQVLELRQPGSPEVIDIETERSLEEHVISAAEWTFLRFFPEETEGYSRYELSIQQARTREEVFRVPVGGLRVLLPPRYLAPGRYRLALYGLQDGKESEALMKFTLRVLAN